MKQPRAGPAQAAASRIAGVDVLRGLAVVVMVAYHAAFDLAYFRMIAANFYRDAFWLNARTAILSSFLLLAGVSLVLAERSARGRAGFWRHVLEIGACAIAVSAASYVVFPQSFIWFGVLHAIAVSLVVVRPLVSRPVVAMAVGIAIIVAGVLFTSTTFDNRFLGWIGFVTAKPVTEDYVPIFPWTGVILLGIAAGHALVRTDFRAVRSLGSWPPPLAFLGRHSLAVYMIHQPLLFGLLWLVARR